MRTGAIPFDPAVAYFSMEVAINDAIPTYCGGLGVLAGDHLRSAADLEMPIVGLTLLYRHGYFRQRLDDDGRQEEHPIEWSPQDLLEPVEETATIQVCGRAVRIRLWRYLITGGSGYQVPVLFLDTDVEDNDERDRAITDQLYGGDRHHRLRQETVLGFGGIALLARLGAPEVPTLHMNEGHAALLGLALLEAPVPTTLAPSSGRLASRQEGASSSSHPAALGSPSALSPTPEKEATLVSPRGGASRTDLDAVRQRCVFTTHTPVPEGHDHFEEELVHHVLGEAVAGRLSGLGCLADGELNMTRLAMSFSRFVNGVSIRHAAVSRSMFPDVPIRSITNGVHGRTWVVPEIGKLLDRHVSGWRQNNALLRNASMIPLPELEAAHRAAKKSMVSLVAGRAGVTLDPAALTLGFARRAVRYKRADLMFRDPERLRRLARAVGPLQIVVSGKAPPPDEGGKEVIRRVHQAAKALRGAITIVYLENYSLDLAAALCAGTDVWVNTPAKPYEASGTSGMKAAMNGVPSLSVLDGWWLEGHIEGVTGWSIGDDQDDSDDVVEADALYSKLETVVAPLFYGSPSSFTSVRRAAIALNGSYFTTERMLRQYDALAYRRPG